MIIQNEMIVLQLRVVMILKEMISNVMISNAMTSNVMILRGTILNAMILREMISNVIPTKAAEMIINAIQIFKEVSLDQQVQQ